MGPDLIGISKNIIRTRELIKHVAGTGLNIVVSGETGVGKEVVVQKLYESSPRKGKPFIKVNCAALPEGLLESELFGYERGAFTGAERKKRGKFKIAHEGVLFLDEIGDMSIPLQSKLLHVLQSGEFVPLGSEKEIRTDTWVIAATNHNLEQNLKNGTFREDLYYRLHIIKIHITPLRERLEDIPLLIDYYIKIYNTQFESKNIIKPNKKVMEKLLSYHWPGNVRQLQNILKRYIVLNDWEKIIEEFSCSIDNTKEDLITSDLPPKKYTTFANFINFEGENSPDLASFSLKKIRKNIIDKVEKEAISYVLNKTGWNRSNAARILKISYKTLLYKISDLNIAPPHQFGK
jgi:two-component system response regulator AtoC